MARRDFLITSFKQGLISTRSASEKCLFSENGKSQFRTLSSEDFEPSLERQELGKWTEGRVTVQEPLCP